MPPFYRNGIVFTNTLGILCAEEKEGIHFRYPVRPSGRPSVASLLNLGESRYHKK